MRNIGLDPRAIRDIDDQVVKILRGLGNPEPPLDLRLVRELQKLDRAYYSTTDDGLLKETLSRLKVAGIQILKRPTILKDAIASFSLKALYLPDQKRILIDADLPKLKHRWSEGHEISHDFIPWHHGMMLGDTEQTLTPSCHQIMEAEANYGAGQLLFLGSRFVEEALGAPPSLARIKALAKTYGNTITSTLWRFVEEAHDGTAMVGLVSGHPHVAWRKPDFDPLKPLRYCIESPAFRELFGHHGEPQLFAIPVGYCGAQKGGLLGSAEVMLRDRNGAPHNFSFETFYNGHQALTLGYWLHARAEPLRGFSIQSGIK